MNPEPSHAAGPPQNHEDRAIACGWFDSSWELQRGLRVNELHDEAAPLWRWVAIASADAGMMEPLPMPR
jgi:hypothetical protein